MEENNRNNNNNNNRHILLMVAIYLLLIMSSDNSSRKDGLLTLSEYMEKNNNTIQNPDIFFSSFMRNSIDGMWSNNNKLNPIHITQNQGLFTLDIQKFPSHYEFLFRIRNGMYVDDGQVYCQFPINASQFQASPIQDGALISITPQFSSNISLYAYGKIFATEVYNRGQKIKQFSISITKKENLQIYLNLTISDPTKNYQQNLMQDNNTIENNNTTEDNNITSNVSNTSTSQKILQQEASKSVSLNFHMVETSTRVYSLILLAGILTLVAYLQFTGVVLTLSGFMNGLQNPGNYSTLTLVLIMVWDCVFCLISFNQAFSNQRGLVLLIIPAFLFCLLFSNLQIRLMLIVYGAHHQNERNIRNLLCKFNMMTYGFLLMTYPLLRFSNLHPVLFIGMCLIFLPQILLNGRKNVRPDLYSSYYTKVLSVRFIIIFYIRGFPWNIFGFKPDYVLCSICLSLIILQLSILWIQKRFGPKKVIPNIFLPAIYNYGCKEDFNIEQGQKVNDCSICLNPLNVQQIEYDIGHELQYKVMKTPCNHTYHGPCLAQWMKIKMQCPECRAELPPFQ